MRRSVALVAAAVTTFSLVVLVSVVYAYRGLAAGPSSASLSADQSVKTVPVADTGSVQAASDNQQAALSQATNLSVQAAASIASQYLNRTDLFSAELSTYKGSPAYKITFSSGAVVYVSMSGEVLGEELPPTYSTTTGSSGGSSSFHSASGSSSSGGHEGGTEHESDDSGSSGGGD
jgi:hypothetical protein